MNGIVISWGKFIRRSSTISQIVGFKDIHIEPVFKSKYLKIFNYVFAIIKSASYLFFKYRKSNVVVLVLPPNYLLYLFLFPGIFKNKKVIVDCHNGCFSKKWLKVTPLFKRLINKCDYVLIHNEDFKIKVDALNIVEEKLLTVVPDPPSFPIGIKSITKDNDYFVFPASYASDEPIDDLLLMAETKEFIDLGVKLFLTGPSYKLDKQQIDRIEKNENIQLTGFLSLEEYDNLLQNSLGVLCLTKKEGVQLCAINEAIGYERIPIYSHTKTLAEMYSEVGLSVKVDLSNLSEVLEACIKSKDLLLEKSQIIRKKRLNDWEKKYKYIFK